MGSIVAFPAQQRKSPEPDTVRVAFDFSRWCVEYFRDGRRVRREPHESRAEALRGAESLHDECGLEHVSNPLPDFSGMIVCPEDRS